MTGSLPGAVLIGFMGSGKSVVGKAVARSLGVPFVDVDVQVEKSAGMPIREIFERQGEAVFRELECRQILVAVSVPGQVIATGGGAFEDSANREVLKAYGTVFHLDVTPETVIRRLGRDVNRPLLQGSDREGRVRELMAARQAAYLQADITIPVDERSVSGIAESIVAHLRRKEGSKR